MESKSRQRSPWRNMSGVFLLMAFACSTLVCSANAADPSKGADDNWIESLVDIMELEYEDQCIARADANWAVLNRKQNAFEDKLDIEKAFGDFAKTQANEITAPMKRDVTDPIYKRRMDLLSKSGDTLLGTDQWNNLVSYSETAVNAMETTKSIDCRPRPPQNCTQAEYIEVLAKSKDPQVLSSAKASWEKVLLNETTFATRILPLLRNSSHMNGYDSVEEYWEMLAEYPDAFKKSQDLWEKLEPLYNDLQKYVVLKLQKNGITVREDGTIPSYLLGSLFGEDWSNIIEMVVPTQYIYEEMNKNIKDKQLGGKNAYIQASDMMLRLGLEQLKESFWNDSVFNKTCPAKLFKLCRGGDTKVFTCGEPSLTNLLDAHDIGMSAMYSQIKALLRANTYMLRDANRFTAMDEALSGLGSLLALSPFQLSIEGVLPIKISQSQKYEFTSRIALQLISALRDLPKLAYYYSADKWRLKLLEGNEPINIGSSWAYERRNISKVSPSDKDYLGDYEIVSNKPYIGKFLGGVLKYQILDVLTSETYDPADDFVRHIGEDSLKLKNLMGKGYAQEWPKLIYKPLQINDISADAMVGYYQQLADFLATELDEPNTEHKYDTESDMPEEIEDFNEENEANDAANQKEIVADKIAEQIVKESQAGPEVAKPIDEPTDNYENNPYLVAKGSEGSAAASSSESKDGEQPIVQASSSLLYVWIGLGLLALIIVILAIVIGRKRYKHKKELERERRDGAA